MGFHFLPICCEVTTYIDMRVKVGDNLYVLLRVEDMERNEV